MRAIRLISYLGVFALMLNLSACKSASSNDSSASLKGVITESSSNQPIQGVNISVDGTSFSSSSAASGAFSFNNLEEGTYTIKATKDGYKPVSKTVTIVSGENTQNLSTQFSLSWDYDNTDSNHILGILDTSTFTVEGENAVNGDRVGVFYIDEGTLKCAGSIIWEGHSTAIAAMGDDTATDEKDGFNSGEQFIWLVRKANGSTYIANAELETGSNSYVSNGYSKVVKIIAD